MLQKEAVAPEMINLLKELQGNSLFKDHILVGGTALTLQLGHRTSTDIVLFTTKTQNAIELTNYFKRNYNNVNVNIAKNDFTRIYVNDIKIEMVQYDEKILEEPKTEEGIRFLGMNEIAAMKLSAITHRTQPRDFIDIAYLLKEI
jgi:predicted nucleotidyltransferase component of viral defense system